MPSLNQVTLIGNLGQDPKIAQTQNGKIVVSFTIATTERGYTKQDGSIIESQTEWHNIVLFGKLAEIAAKYLKRGMMVFVQGKLKTRSYQKEDGIKRYITEIVGDSLQMLDKKDKSESKDSSQVTQNPYIGKTVDEIINDSNDMNDAPF